MLLIKTLQMLLGALTLKLQILPEDTRLQELAPANLTLYSSHCELPIVLWTSRQRYKSWTCFPVVWRALLSRPSHTQLSVPFNPERGQIILSFKTQIKSHFLKVFPNRLYGSYWLGFVLLYQVICHICHCFLASLTFQTLKGKICVSLILAYFTQQLSQSLT